MPAHSAHMEQSGADSRLRAHPLAGTDGDGAGPAPSGAPAAPTGQVQLKSVPASLSSASDEAAAPLRVVLLAAFHAFLARTHNQEVTCLSVQLGDADSAAVPVACPPVGPDDSLAAHAARLQQQLAAPGAAAPGPVQAGVAVGAAAAASAAAGGLGLALLLSGDDGAEQAALVFSRAVLSNEAAALVAAHFEVFVSALAAASPPALLQAPLMDAAERELVLVGFNDTDVPYDAAKFVHGLFMDAAKATPDAPCVIFEGHVFSYAEIDAASTRIAHYLRSQAGVLPGDIVGVLVLRGPLMMAALLGVFKAGAGYLPLDHHHPTSRIEFMLEDAAVKAVVTQPDLLDKLPASTDLGLHVLQLYPELVLPDGPADGAEPVPAHLPLASLGAAAGQPASWTLGQLGGPETTCYIIYTSGSTGKPKGVVVLHKGLAAYCAWFRTHFGIIPADVFIQKTPTNFDASVDEMWPSMSAGASLVVAPPEAHRDVHSVMTLITRHKVTTSSAVPSQLHLLAREILAAHSAEDVARGVAPCASLRRVLSGGEALTTTMAADIYAAMPRCELHNTYGPTETTVGITSWLYDPAAPARPGGAVAGVATIPIGRAGHNGRLYVLDASMQPTPVGVPGQLFISGVQVAGGYLNRADLDATTFVPNPFCEGPGTHTDKMYRTGDLVRWLPGQHACLEFLGRVDHQVKLRGFRIELQEVEAVMGALPGVRQVVTALAKHPTTQQDHLVAWASPATLDRVELLQQLQRSSLPEYMIPTAMVLLDELPLLVSEKVNRKALPPPDFARDAVSAPAAPAASTAGSGDGASGGQSEALEPFAAYVAGVWASVLGVDHEGLATGDDFFATHGGNSLLAGRMNGRLRSELRLPSMSGMVIYMHPTLGAFAKAIEKAGGRLPSPGSDSGSGVGVGSGCSSLAPGRGASMLSSAPSTRLGSMVSSTVSMTSHGGISGSSSDDSYSSGGSFTAGSPPSSLTCLSGASACSSLPRSGSCASAASYRLPAKWAGMPPSFSAGSLVTPCFLVGTVPPTINESALADASGAERSKSSLKFKLAPPFLFRDGGKQPLGAPAPPERVVRPSVALATAVQLAFMCLVGVVPGVLAMVPMLLSMYALLLYGIHAVLILPIIEFVSWVLLTAFAISGKWMFIGRYREGRHPLWGGYYLRHWIATQFVLGTRSAFVPMIRCTTLLNWFYRALGVKIGRDVVIDTDDLIGFDLITIKDGVCLDTSSGVSAITYIAGQEHDEFPTGTMQLKPAVVGERVTVGPHAMVVQSDVANDTVVLPCSASTNPEAGWPGSRYPGTCGDALQKAVRTKPRALGVLSALLAMWVTTTCLGVVAYPFMIGFWFFWMWLAGHFLGRQITWLGISDNPADVLQPLQCFVRPPGPGESLPLCTQLRDATVIAMLVTPLIMVVTGQLVVWLIVPLKRLFLGTLEPCDGDKERTWGQLFVKQVMRCLVDHPVTRASAFIWTGTAVFNAWLRALGAKVGTQAWIGEDLKLHEHDLVEIGDCVSICSSVSMQPSAVMGSNKITIGNGADVTNQTALYPGVTVKPGAVLGVFTYAEAGRNFPRHSITQGPMVLSAGEPEPLPAKPGAEQPADPADGRRVSRWVYARFNLLYAAIMLTITVVSPYVTGAPFGVFIAFVAFGQGVWLLLALAPLAWGAGFAVSFLWMALIKKVLLPRCKGNNPFYSYTHTAWMVDGLLLYFQQGGMLRSLSGSQMAVWFYRLHGARIGRGVLLLGLHSQEPDCLTIGDYTVCDDMAFVMAHTVENRCLKFHDVTIGSRVTIGCGSCVLPGCALSDGSRLGDVSLLMKGETLPPGAVWRGVPAQPCEDGMV